MANEVQLREVKATLSAIVDQAVSGQPTIITRHGHREAVILGYEDWQRLSAVPSFGQFLAACPLTDDDLPSRTGGGLRDVEL